VLTQQLQEPITESAQEDKYIHSKEINVCLRALLTLKVEKSLICLVGTRIPTAFMIK
jgi:hypothetical protein